MTNIGQKIFYISLTVTIISIVLLVIFLIIDNRDKKKKVKHSTFYNVSFLIVSIIFLFSSIITYGSLSSYKSL